MKGKEIRSIYMGILGLFFLCGCTNPVGGECKYGERTKGYATIKFIHQGECIVDFRPNNRILAEWSVEKRFKDMGAECYILGKIGVGKTYPAIYEKEISGTCKPYKVIVYDKEFLKKSPNLAKEYHLE